MTTYGSDTPFWKFALGFVLALALIAGAIMAANDERNHRLQKEQAADCSTFKHRTLDEVPARCVTPQGGFKQ